MSDIMHVTSGPEASVCKLIVLSIADNFCLAQCIKWSFGMSVLRDIVQKIPCLMWIFHCKWWWYVSPKKLVTITRLQLTLWNKISQFKLIMEIVNLKWMLSFLSKICYEDCFYRLYFFGCVNIPLMKCIHFLMELIMICVRIFPGLGLDVLVP
jgi:hypothetical protein